MRVRSLSFTLALTGILFSAVSWWRCCLPKSVNGQMMVQKGMEENQFWVKKYCHSSDSDIVVIGDSRIMMGISPDAIRQVIPTARVTNYGFNNVGYGPRYFDAVNRVLDKQSKLKVIVVGISPLNFQPSHVDTNEFMVLSKQNMKMKKSMGGITNMLRPIALAEVKMFLKGKDTIQSGYYQVLHDDGWLQCTTIPENPSRLLEPIETGLINEPVDNKLIDDLLKRVKIWKQSGIQVYGLRVPTTAAMRDVENRHSSFDEASFRLQLNKVGGKWIDTGLGGYRCYDGSHLQPESAVKLSKVVGEYIKKDFDAKDVPPVR